VGIASKQLLEMLKAPLERDLQALVGPSSLCSECSYCLAQEMLGNDRGLGTYWLGARIGTCVHHELEALLPLHRPDDLSERRVRVGEIPGYGEIYGTADWTVGGDVRDLKTTTKEKLKWIKAAILDEEPLKPYTKTDLSKLAGAKLKVGDYFRQAQLYGKGFADEGREVKSVTLVFICRDGTTDDDVWDWPMTYDPAVAEAVLDRASRLWYYLQDGEDAEVLNSAPGCFTCSMEGRI
jgi:hypothetical protein